MFKYLYTAKACSEIDQLAMARMSLSETELMQRAASAAMHQIERHWPRANRISIYCGPGNNGGDGYLLAVEALKTGRDVTLFAFVEPKSSAAKVARESAISSDIDIKEITSKTFQDIDKKCDLIVDGFFGHGLERNIAPPLAQLFDVLNQSSVPIFSLDIPSGINSDTGAVMGCALKAQRSICFVAPKLGLYSGKGVEYAGKVCHDDLGISRDIFNEVDASHEVIRQQSVVTMLPQPGECSHKGNMGRLGVIGGQPGMIGATILAGNAAMRSGAGCVTIFSHESHIASVQQVNPVLMTQAINTKPALELSSGINALVLGPGLGSETENGQQPSWSKLVFDQVLNAVFARKLPLVVDADGLNILARCPQHYPHWVLTPHPKEAARLLQTSTARIEVDRPAACRKIARRYGGVCVLKGKGSLIAKPTGAQFICIDGNWGMASAGSGDVLSGVIGAFLAAGLKPHQAASAAVYVHATAGDIAAVSYSKRAMIASDIVSALPRVFKAIELAGAR